MNRNKMKLNRRNFLLAAGGAGAFALVAKDNLGNAPQVSPAGDAEEKSGGYHLSQHIKKYYKTTLI